MQHFLKPAARIARTEIVAAQLLVKHLVSVHDAKPALHIGLGRISPSSAYWSVRKEGAFSLMNLFFIMHLQEIFLTLGEGGGS